ncbi:MAG: hypothetical protein K2V38_14455, partial [Gemmataceae bacterium]|nr:hypothetical protein [Gemmataceae bacterium]
MSRRVVVAAVGVALLFVVGLVLPFLLKARMNSHVVGSRNNLRELALFAAHHANPDPARDSKKLPTEIPPATIALPDTAPADRLSWVVDVIPGLDQRRVNGALLLETIDRTKPWAADANQRAARARIAPLLCPEGTPDVAPVAPGMTCYVGISGTGADAASLPPTS